MEVMSALQASIVTVCWGVASAASERRTTPIKAVKIEAHMAICIKQSHNLKSVVFAGSLICSVVVVPEGCEIALSLDDRFLDWQKCNEYLI